MSHEHVTLQRITVKLFGIGITLNLAFVILEVIYGLLSNSLALVADAGHNLSDVLGLCLCVGSNGPRKEKADHRADIWSALRSGNAPSASNTKENLNKITTSCDNRLLLDNATGGLNLSLPYLRSPIYGLVVLTSENGMCKLGV